MTPYDFPLAEDATPWDRLVDAMAIIETFPELHDQRVWWKQTSCGTAHCLGGWARARSGETVANRDQMAKLLGFSKWYPAAVHPFGTQNTVDDLYRLSAEQHNRPEQDLRDAVGKLRAERGWL